MSETDPGLVRARERAAAARKRYLAERPPVHRGRERLRRFFEHPWTETIIAGLIMAWVGLFFVEIFLPAGDPAREVLERIGQGITVLFGFELALRFWASRSKRTFLRRYWPDLLAVVPLLRPVRLVRVLVMLRLFRLGAMLARRIQALAGLIRGNLQEFMLLGTLSVALLLGAAIALQLAEAEVNQDFGSVEQVLWFSAYSMVGGEPIGGTPQTPLGRAATLVLMFGGMTTFGMFVGTFSAAMVQRLATQMDNPQMDLEELTSHTLVCGWNRAGPATLLELFSPGNRTIPHVVLITEKEQLEPPIPSEGIQHNRLYRLTGDYTRVELLERAGVRHANLAILLTDSTIPRSDQDRDARTVLAALTIERLHPDIFTVAELTNRQNTSLLKLAGVEEIVVADDYRATIVGSAARNRGLVSVLDEILTTRYGNAFHKVVVPDRMDGTSIGQLHIELKERHQALLMALERRDDETANNVIVNPDNSLQVHAGDRLLVLCRHNNLDLGGR